MGRWALAGVALLALAVGIAVGAVWRPFGGPAQPTPTEPQNVFALPVGACLASFEDAWQPEYDLVDCAEPHAAEVLGTVPVSEVFDASELPSSSGPVPSLSSASASSLWPGDALLASRANLACEQVAGAAADALLAVRWPLADDWAAARSYVCFAVLPTPSGTPSVAS